MDNSNKLKLAELKNDKKNSYHRLFGIELLGPVLNGSYLPFTNSSLKPLNIATILNEIIINKRRRIVEFGSGISTILICRLIKLNKLKASIVSIDHDYEWIEIIKNIIQNEELDHFVHFIHAPLSKTKNGDEWYDQSLLKSELESLKFQLVIIDGPPAWMKNLQLARYPAFGFIADFLDDDFALFLDDADREGENIIISLWKKGNGIEFYKITDSLAYCSSHRTFNPTIL